MAVLGGWASGDGRVNRDGIFNGVLQMFATAYHRQRLVDIDDLEDAFITALAQQFNTEAEDGSPRQMAVLLMTLWRDCMAGDFRGLHHLLEQPDAVPQAQRVAGGYDTGDDANDTDAEDEDGDGDRNDDAMGGDDDFNFDDVTGGDAAPPAEDDGWTTVKHNNNRN
jgi:hypothetical protein